ncbi:NBPF family member NBPF6-like [Lycaon pictus]
MIIGRKKTKARYAPSTPWNTRLHRELPVAEENEVPQDSLDESYWTPSVGHDLPDACRPYTSASFTSDKQELFLGLDVDAPMQVPCHRGLLSGNLTFLRAEVQTSRAQPQPSIRRPILCSCSWASSWIVVTTEPGSTSPPPSGAWQPRWVLGTKGHSPKSWVWMHPWA